jgi:hypothetical protein
MTATIQIRRDVTGSAGSGWSSNPTLALGELGLNTTLNALKVGDGSTAWNSLPWLGGTFPQFSPSVTDLNDSSLRVQGIYRWSSANALTNGPASPIALASSDGGVNLLVIVHATGQVVQQLWTDGDTSVVQKSYSRNYDNGTYRPWIPQSVWAIDATNGVELTAKSLTLKDTGASSLVVDGAATIAGNVTINGATTLGDANADIVTVQAGTVSAPIITTSGDTNTGVYFPAADKVAVTAGATAQLTLDGTAAANSASSAVFRGGATFDGTISVSSTPGTFGIQGVANAWNLFDAVSFSQLFGGFRSDAGSPSGFPDANSAAGLIVMHYETGSTGSVVPSTTTWTGDTSDLADSEWRHRFGSSTVEAYIRPKSGQYVGIWLVFNGGTFQTAKMFTRANPCLEGQNNLLGTTGDSTKHVLFMLKIGSA